MYLSLRYTHCSHLDMHECSSFQFSIGVCCLNYNLWFDSILFLLVRDNYLVIHIYGRIVELHISAKLNCQGFRRVVISMINMVENLVYTLLSNEQDDTSRRYKLLAESIFHIELLLD